MTKQKRNSVAFTIAALTDLRKLLDSDLVANQHIFSGYDRQALEDAVEVLEEVKDHIVVSEGYTLDLSKR